MLLLTCGHRVTCGVCRCFVLSLIFTEGNSPSLPFMHREQLNHNHIPVDCTIPSLGPINKDVTFKFCI